MKAGDLIILQGRNLEHVPNDRIGVVLDHDDGPHGVYGTYIPIFIAGAVYRINYTRIKKITTS